MTYAKSTKEVLKKIGCSSLTLEHGQGYWYFVYDDVPAKIFETESVYTVRLNDLTLDTWIEIGKSFVEKVEKGN